MNKRAIIIKTMAKVNAEVVSSLELNRPGVPSWPAVEGMFAGPPECVQLVLPTVLVWKVCRSWLSWEQMLTHTQARLFIYKYLQ
ncbi:hypothetical protein FGO68_gene12923 [Halteria grandinella]|uniref:Uncharacterized protein n=1 Tax=Halteria grandinella TaxID=5974 RepID=A0A8J8NHS3_HALGN|nr:hypothetical protein FGO68_gene12923 [Halteria grandinella]